MQQPIPSNLGFKQPRHSTGEMVILQTDAVASGANGRGKETFHTEEGKTNTHNPSSACPLPWQRPSCVSEQHHSWSSETSGRNPEPYVYDLALSLFLV